MSTAKDIFETLRQLSALETRTADVAQGLHRIEDKINALLERIAKLEVEHKHLRESVRNEILADITAEFSRIQTRIDIERGRSDGAGARKAPPARRLSGK